MQHRGAERKSCPQVPQQVSGALRLKGELGVAGEFRSAMHARRAPLMEGGVARSWSLALQGLPGGQGSRGVLRLTSAGAPRAGGFVYDHHSAAELALSTTGAL